MMFRSRVPYRPEQAVALPQPKIVTPKHDVELSMGFGLSL